MRNISRREFIGSAAALGLTTIGCNRKLSASGHDELKPVTGKVIDIHTHLLPEWEGPFKYLPEVCRKVF